MASDQIAWPSTERLSNHWDWRPEWTPSRPCLYWYLTFDSGQLTAAVGPRAVEVAEAVSWLDPVPVRWMHLTLCEVGFVDELDPDRVTKAVTAVGREAGRVPPLRLTLGPAAVLSGALVLQAGPVQPLRGLRDRLLTGTGEAIGSRPQRVHQLWPHVSLGYVNRATPASDAARLLEALGPVSGQVTVSRLTLASVTRRDRHYRWTVRASLPLRGAARPTSTTGR